LFDFFNATVLTSMSQLEYYLEYFNE
jgi:hypothetical protein